MREIYYETSHYTDENNFPLTVAHDDFEAAAQYADEHGIEEIEEIGGSFTIFRKCWWCEEWFDVCELSEQDECPHCEAYLKSRC